MNVLKTGVLSTVAVVLSVVASMFGGWDAVLQTLVVLMAVDYLTGIACALVWKKSPKSESGAFESMASLKGLLRKGMMLGVVLIASQIDIVTGTGFVRDTVIFFFIGNDGLSIIENLGVIGVPLPNAIKQAFEALRTPKT